MDRMHDNRQLGSSAWAQVRRRCIGVGRGVRRGTVLILVLGVLALLAVITAVYVSVGQADRRTGETVKHTKAIDEAAQRVADHVATIVAADALSTTFERFNTSKQNPSGDPVLRREAFDYPYTDYPFRSIFANVPASVRLQRDGLRFDPAGSFSVKWPLTGTTGITPDPRHASDPFLASTEPTYMRSSTNGAEDFDPTSPADQFKNNLDWAHISNIAPDGRYVNLFNLRPSDSTSGPYSGKGFDAKAWEMSGLTQTGTVLNSAAPLTFLTVKNKNDYPVSTLTPNFGAALNYNSGDSLANHPAFFSNGQRFAFRPMDISDKLDWSDADYIRYQWADADGDGFADSRWQELIDLSDPQSAVNLMPGGEYRWFVAARIIDLSGLVNVNTATDFLTAGSSDIPTGMTPGEVDVRRLLMLTDATTSGPSAVRYSEGYQNLRNPASGTESTSDYSKYLDGQAANAQRAAKVGGYAYAALEKSLLSGITAAPGFDLKADPIDPISSLRIAGGSFDWTHGPFGNLERLLRHPGSNDPNAPVINPFARMMMYQEAASAQWRADSIRSGARGYMGVTDLVELLTYRGANDDTILSRLEQVLDARLPNSDVAASASGTAYDGVPLSARYGPLRSSRGVEYERRGRADVNGVRGIDEGALRQMAFDVRQRISPITGTRPIAPNLIQKAPGLLPAATPNSLDNDVDLRIDAPSQIGQAIFNSDADLRQTAARNLFKGYLEALAPFINEGGTPANIKAIDWRPAAATDQSNNWVRRTLAYGYDGPELAFNLAAHLVMNLVDAFDDDATPPAKGSTTVPPIDDKSDRPTVMTVIMDKSLSTVLTKDANPVAQRKYPFAASGDGLRLPPENIYTANADPAKAPTAMVEPALTAKLRSKTLGNVASAPLYSPAKNVYGLEAFPIITEAVTMYLYGDTPSGSADITVHNPDGTDTITPTIDGSLDATNEDLLMDAVAFQIHNPFDKEINLTKVGTSGNEFPYYLQFAGRAFMLCDSDRDPTGTSPIEVKLAPGATRWFFFLPHLKNLETRFSSFKGGAGVSTQLQDLIAKQLSLDPTAADKPCLMLQIDPTTGVAVSNATAPVKLLSSDADENRVVRLWRAMRFDTAGDKTGAAANAVENDMLVDRLRDPRTDFGGEPILARRLKEGVVKVEGVNPADNDDTSGLTLMFMNAIKRPDESKTPPIGGIPAYMLEATTSTNTVKNVTGYNNDYSQVVLEADSLDILMFDSSAGHAARKSPSLFSDAFIDGPSIGYVLEHDRFLLKPNLRFTDPLGNTVDNRTLDQVRASYFLANNRLTQRIHSTGPTGNGSAVDPQNVPGVLRLGDLVTQLAIGAEFDPWRGLTVDSTGMPTAELDTDEPNRTLTSGGNKIYTNAWKVGGVPGGEPDTNFARADDPRWLTFGEAMAIALNYDAGRKQSVPPDPATKPVPNPYYRLGTLDKTANPKIWPKLDRGMLVLDDYTPYENLVGTPNTVYDIPNPTSASAPSDKIRGLGIPVALNIASNFRVLGRYKIDSIASNNELKLTREPMGDITKVVPGQININTAPAAVLRLLPMLSPTQGPDILEGGVAAEWWGYGTSADDLTGSMGVTTRNSDIAARVLAYRDKLRAFPTRQPATGPIQNIGYGNFFSGFSGTAQFAMDAYGGGTGRYDTLNDVNWTPAQTPRQLVVREQPGFRSIGEVMMATNRDRSMLDPNLAADPNSIDFLGRDKDGAQPRLVKNRVVKIDNKDTQIGTASRVYAAPGASGVPLLRDRTSEVANSPDERLAVFNAIANSISVSSDYYACWFVLHGYKRTDVENLRPGDPLVPSVARRYLMILDRSNVVTTSDRPRIVVFKELPM